MASSASKQAPRRALIAGDLERLRRQGPRLLRWYEEEAPVLYRARLLRALPTIGVATLGAAWFGWSPTMLLLFLQLDCLGRVLADLVLLIDPEHRSGSRWDRLHAARSHTGLVLANLARDRASINCHSFGSAHREQILAIAALLAIAFALPWGLLASPTPLADQWALPGLCLAAALGVVCIAGHLLSALWTLHRSGQGRLPTGGPDMRSLGFLLWMPVLLVLSAKATVLAGGAEPAGLLLASARIEIALLLLVVLPVVTCVLAVGFARRNAAALRRWLRPEAYAWAVERLQRPDPGLDPAEAQPLRELTAEDLEGLRREGPGVLAYYRAGATCATRDVGITALIGALVPLLGVLLFGWSPAALVLLIAADWVALFLADCLRLAQAPEACVAQDAYDETERRSSERLRGLDEDGWVARNSKALPPSVGRLILMLALVGIVLLPIALGMVWTVVLLSHYAGTGSEINPFHSPAGLLTASLLLSMVLVLLSRLVDAVLSVRRSRRTPPPHVGLGLSSVYLMAVPFAMIPLLIAVVLSDAGGTVYMAAVVLLAIAAGRAALGVGWLLRAQGQESRLDDFLALDARTQAQRMEDALRGASAPLPD